MDSKLVMLLVIVVVTFILLAVGFFCYYSLIGENVVDSYYGMALTITGLDLQNPPQTPQQKMFFSTYILIAVAFYPIMIATITTYLLTHYFDDKQNTIIFYPYSPHGSQTQGLFMYKENSLFDN